jgi:hypothetical protein
MKARRAVSSHTDQEGLSHTYRISNRAVVASPIRMMLLSEEVFLWLIGVDIVAFFY